MGLLDPIIAVPRVTFRKLEQLVEDVVYLEDDEEVDGSTRRELAEQLATRILTEYVREHFEEQSQAVAQDMVRRRRDRKRFFEEGI